MVIDSMGEGLGIVDPEERFIFVNPAGAEIFGLSQGDLMGRCLQEFMSPFQWSGVRAQTSLREKGERSSYDLRITRADGEERVLRVTGTPQHDADGRFAGTFGVFSDVTEQIRAEEHVKELAGLLDVSPLSVTVHDERGVWLYANDRTMSMHGYSKEEFMTLTLSQVDVPESAQLIDERMRLIAAKGEALFEVRHLRKDGSSFPLEVSVKKTTWFGKPALLSLAWDITERKRMEEEKDKLQEQLNQAQKMESVGQLAGGVAHDFNNMLGAILGHVELALESVGSDQPLLENLLEIRKATERSAELTRQLLAFARKQTVAPRTLDLNDSVSSMLKMLRRLIGEDIDLIWLPGRDTSFVKIEQRLGYTVLAANTPAEAVRLAQEHPGKIDLLLTDVVMPEMNGRDLARIIMSILPDVKRLFMSGYTADAIAHHGMLEEGVHFLQKPFSGKHLAAKVREVLKADWRADR